jgi:hypothetical protein
MLKRATYGGADCTEQVRTRCKDGKFNFWVNNSIIGDPAPGVLKKMEIWLENGEYLVFNEHTLATYPASTLTRLGIWYTNNDNPKTERTILASLDNLNYISNMDIITSVWHPIKRNKFPELISPYRVSSHLNQLLQILQCLYFAREIKEYDYVSFLEHDVLYPSDYSSFPDFAEDVMLCNMNYGGLCYSGWQEKNQQDQPMHQITMRFSAAIRQMEGKLANALNTNSGCIEPEMKRVNWECKNQAIHINNGYHFTSHNSIYSKDTYPDHKYWGNYKLYQKLFPDDKQN